MMRRGPGSRAALASALLSAGLAAAPAAAATLTLEAVGPDGAPAAITGAEVLLVSWGESGRIPLEPEGSRVAVPLEEAWVAERWPEAYRDLVRAYLYLEAEGLAPVRSEPFAWPGERQVHQGRERSATEVAFPGGERVVVGPQEDVALTVALRRPRERHLRLADADGAPVPGVAVQAFMHWSRDNPCDQLVETHPLAEATSDAEGRVALPDGDFEIALVLDKELWVVDDPRGLEMLPPRAVVTFDEAEETVTLRRLERVPLDLRVVFGGTPVTEAPVEGCLARCPCGACCREVAVSGEGGRLRVDSFYPARWQELYIKDRAGFKIWSADPRRWLESGPPEQIELEP